MATEGGDGFLFGETFHHELLHHLLLVEGVIQRDIELGLDSQSIFLEGEF